MAFYLRKKLRNHKKREWVGTSSGLVGPARYYRNTKENQSKRKDALKYKGGIFG